MGKKKREKDPLTKLEHTLWAGFAFIGLIILWVIIQVIKELPIW